MPLLLSRLWPWRQRRTSSDAATPGAATPAAGRRSGGAPALPAGSGSVAAFLASSRGATLDPSTLDPVAPERFYLPAGQLDLLPLADCCATVAGSRLRLHSQVAGRWGRVGRPAQRGWTLPACTHRVVCAAWVCMLRRLWNKRERDPSRACRCCARTAACCEACSWARPRAACAAERCAVGRDVCVGMPAGKGLRGKKRSVWRRAEQAEGAMCSGEVGSLGGGGGGGAVMVQRGRNTRRTPTQSIRPCRRRSARLPIHSRVFLKQVDLSGAFQPCCLPDATCLLRLLYCPEEAHAANFSALAAAGRLPGVVALAHRLDADRLLAALEAYLQGEWVAGWLAGWLVEGCSKELCRSSACPQAAAHLYPALSECSSPGLCSPPQHRTLALLPPGVTDRLGSQQACLSALLAVLAVAQQCGRGGELEGRCLEALADR